MSTAKRSLRPTRWALHFRCNHHRTGMPTGGVDTIQFGAGRGNFVYGTDYLDDYELSLSGPRVRFAWAKSKTAFRLWTSQAGPVMGRCTGYQPYVGNWCWDACFVTADTLRRLAPWLKRQGWLPESGTEILWRWWKKIETTGAQ